MWTTIKTLKPLTIVFWMTLHATSALAATIILTTLSKTRTLTPNTTTTLTYLKTTAALYYRQLALTTIETCAYQPTPYWEFITHTTIKTALLVAHNPTALATITILAALTATIRYALVLYLLRAETATQLTLRQAATYQRITQATCLLIPASTQPPKPKNLWYYLRRLTCFLMYLTLK